MSSHKRAREETTKTREVSEPPQKRKKTKIVKVVTDFCFRSGHNILKTSRRGNVVNQDSYLLNENLIAVLDGHGNSSQDLVLAFKQYFEDIKTNCCIQDCDADTLIQEAIAHVRKNSPELFNRAGTTFIGLRRDTDDDNTFEIVQIGDSRCMRIYKDEQDAVAFEWLTRDHDLTSDEEKKRVDESDHGYIEKRKGPTKVLNYLSSRKSFFSVNMSRAIGDEVLTSAGMINTPQTYPFIRDQEKDIALILMSDGVSDVLTNEEWTELLKKEAWELDDIYKIVTDNTHNRCGRLDDCTMLRLNWN